MKQGEYQQGSLSLIDAVSMGTGVMIGAGIFALTGQIAELAGPLYPYAFLAAAAVASFSAYSYVKLANAYPSAGGIATFLIKAYGKGVATASFAMMMALSMVINESLVARTFGTYALQPFDVGGREWLVPALGVGVLVFAFAVNVSGNHVIGRFSLLTAIVKIGGVMAFAVAAMWVSGRPWAPLAPTGAEGSGPVGFLAATALGVLAYKGFTTITNSGGEIEDPHRNVGRAIVIALGICTVVYLAVALGVGSNLDVRQIVEARDFALAAATRPALGPLGLSFTVVIAVLATAAGLIASTFAVSRMLAMVTDMKLVPHSHFGMSGTLQKHTLVYTVVAATALTVAFDLSRIASLGAILYLVMDIGVHWGVLRHLRKETGANPAILVAAIALDAAVLVPFCVAKARSDPLVLWVAAATLAVVIGGEAWFLRSRSPGSERS